MRTIRRLYFYAVALISLEVVLWGLINLARATFVPDPLVSLSTRLAQALSLVLVGVPVFILHWVPAQRGAQQDEDEHASAIRAVFLYAALLATLLPIVQNIWAVLNRSLLQASGLPLNQAILGGDQTLADNLIAILMNGVVAVYFLRVTRQDWQTLRNPTLLADVRRLYRYLWVAYALILVVSGVYQMLYFIFYVPDGEIGRYTGAWVMNGLALLLVGVPLWLWTWRTVQNSLTDAAESGSNLRLGVLYLLAVGSVFVVLASSGVILYVILRLGLGESLTFGEVMNQLSNPLSLGIPFAALWGYYGGWFRRTVNGISQPEPRAGVRRLYFYVLSLAGLTASFIGLSMLLSFILDLGLVQQIWGDALRTSLAAALATLFVGLPLWLLTWRPMQAEAMAATDSGDHARRSVVRKAYLYLVLFAAVIGGMSSAGAAIYQVLNAVLGETPLDVFGDFMDAAQWFVLFMGLLAYHLYVLRRDGSQAARALAAKHSQFPTLVFDEGDGQFGEAMWAALQKQSAYLPVQVRLIEDGVPLEIAFKAVVLPANLALNPPEALRLWLREFNGSRLVVPFETEGWVWVCAPGKSSNVIAQAATVVRQLAEGSEARGEGPSGWIILVYILAALAAIPVLMTLLSLALSTFID